MSTLSQFTGGDGPVSSIVNYFSGGSVNGVTMPSPGAVNVKETLSGAATAATLVTILNITGRGRANFVAAKTKDSTARTVRLQITIDGTVAFNATTNSIAVGSTGLCGIGSEDNGGLFALFQPINFYTSFKVEIATSLTETDKISALYNYEVYA